MNGIISEKDYPVQGLWVFKSILGYLIVLIILVPVFIFQASASNKTDFRFYIFVGLAIFHFVVTILRRATFHYSIEDRFLSLRQGIFSKQQRHIPFGVIQNLFVKQDIFDRILGFASLTIENASQGTGGLAVPKEQKIFGMKVGTQKRQQELVGFSGNKVSIPGLTKANAETLKEILLQKIKDNPTEDNQSGL